MLIIVAEKILPDRTARRRRFDDYEYLNKCSYSNLVWSRQFRGSFKRNRKKIVLRREICAETQMSSVFNAESFTRSLHRGLGTG